MKQFKVIRVTGTFRLSTVTQILNRKLQFMIIEVFNSHPLVLCAVIFFYFCHAPNFQLC